MHMFLPNIYRRLQLEDNNNNGNFMPKLYVFDNPLSSILHMYNNNDKSLPNNNNDNTYTTKWLK